ncbi:hypothetical protein MKW94_007467 [Papaver nudicaule]|uniref:Small ubiquitin-related modifier n=1 Tax=Papaver nudicaule TaxID=74823 RepID=A0AA41W187_PAPNU|nr:hypothetical protein [Papaver nudicaule]
MAGVTNVVKVEANKPDAVEPATHINVKIRSNGNVPEYSFRVKRSAPMKKLMDAYGEASKIDIRTIKFLFDGKLLKPVNTPDQLELEDGDEIQVVEGMIGG